MDEMPMMVRISSSFPPPTPRSSSTWSNGSRAIRPRRSSSSAGSSRALRRAPSACFTESPSFV